MTGKPTLLLEHHLKELKLPSFLREYGKMAAQCAAEGVDHPSYLLRLARAGTDRPPAADGGAADPGGPLPRREEPGHLRLHRHPLHEQGLGDGAGPLRIHRAPGQRHRCRQQRHRQDPRRPGAGTGRLPAGYVCGLHHGCRPGPRADGGPGREDGCSTCSGSFPVSAC